MARGGLVLVGVGVLAIAGLAALAGSASAAEPDPRIPRRPPPPPPPKPPAGGGGLTPMQKAKQHPNYSDWLYATQQCDAALASDDPGNSALLGFCDDAAYFAGVMVNDGVPPGKWR